MNRDAQTHRVEVNRGGLIAVALVVAVVSLLMRLPSCQESFWLDELHSAWTVSGEFSAVAERAALGNQTTGYFHSLWIWHGLVGSDELRMRLSSVIMVTLTAVLLAIGVSLQTRRVFAGMISGGIVALDSNAVFFGCELRPYAAVMLCAVLATWAMMTWLDGGREGESPSWSLRGARWRLAALFFVCVAALLHPTSLGVLFWLVPLGVVSAWFRGRLTLWRADGIAVLVVLVTLGLLAVSSLPNSWEHRQQWKAFGHVTQLTPLWYAWSWVPIVFVPIVIGLVGAIVRHLTRQSESEGWVGMLPMLAGTIGTLTFFCASYFDVVPLWHRRYFIAALPLLAWSAGVASTYALPTTKIGGWKSFVIAIGVLLSLCWYQGSLAQFRQGQIPRQLRGEGWREAVAYTNERRTGQDAVWLDSGLIENGFFRQPIDESAARDVDWHYLAFPLEGPYRVENPIVVSASEHPSWLDFQLAQTDDEAASIWIISRSHPKTIDRLLSLVERKRSFDVQKRAFGSIRVIQIRLRAVVTGERVLASR